MAGTSAQGATFTFKGSKFTITSISVEQPTAEVVDMTAWNDSADKCVLVPTGAWTGGSVSIDYLHTSSAANVTDLVRKTGTLAFSSAGFSYSRNAILESATTAATVNDLVRGTMKFRLTDYYAS
jgi:hypothetical protein